MQEITDAPARGLPGHLLLCSVSHSVISDSLRLQGPQPARFLCPWDSPGKNNGMGSHAFLQGIILTQGLNPRLLYCRQILYCPSSLAAHK